MLKTFLAVSLGLCAAGSQAAQSTGSHKVLAPEDLGPSEIDVSGYPPEHQKAYREIFLPVFKFLEGPARVLNSPLIEMDPRLEEKERLKNPELFADPLLAEVSQDAWRKKVNEIRTKPPCCGACPVLSLQDARALWRFLVYDSLARKTGKNAGAWMRRRRSLLERFKREYPERFDKLYSKSENKKEEGIK